MVKYILKFELSLLFVLTLLSFFSFYYGATLPDNILSISSNSEEIHWFSFYLFSIVSIIGHYVGPWVFFSFFFFAIFYASLLCKRLYKLDIFIVVSLVLQNIFFVFILNKNFLGSGISNLVSKYFSYNSALLYSFIFLFVFLSSIFREKFLVKMYSFIKNLFLYSFKFIYSFISFSYFSYIFNFIDYVKKLRSKTSMQVTSLLRRGKIIKSENISSYNNSSLGVIRRTLFESPKEDISKIRTVADNKYTTNQNILKKSSGENSNYFDLMNSIPTPADKVNTLAPDKKYFSDIISRIETKLSEFKIEGKIINVLKGPVVDTFELELGVGVRVSKVTNAEKDLSIALFGASIRIVYPMMGRTTMGIEVPRNPRDIIYLDEVITDPSFLNSSYHLPIIIGKDAFGVPFVKDLASMPHMLVAGSTGSGKSVFINTVLISLLVKRSPEQMKLILIDPKQLELALYAKLPHLLLPVMTKAKNASISLLWAVEEMEKRYSVLKDFGVRNLDGFNTKILDVDSDMIAKVHHYYEEAKDNSFQLPYIVIIVDEFADLILTKAGKDIEQNICRLAQKARAAGIHLILATQRPSVDVVTGLIKANFPIRVSFKVSSSTDSRTILGINGAEKLLGKGDMIFKSGTNSNRVHSAFIAEEEIEKLTKKLELIETSFDSKAVDFLENNGEENSSVSFVSTSPNSTPTSIKLNEVEDELFREAVDIVIDLKSASASMLQRRLRIGYNRAANLVEEMEKRGIVGPPEGSKKRKVLVIPS